jgi:HSP20 family protein
MLQRWNPWSDFDRLWTDIDRLFSERAGRSRAALSVSAFRPAIDLYDADDQLVIKAVIPGARPEGLQLSLEQNVLTIQGSYGYQLPDEQARNITWYRQEIGQGQFAESISLPVPVNAEQIQATFEDGILTVRLPKAEQARTKAIPIQSAKAVGSGASGAASEERSSQ